jgi:hypothetical protein
LDSIAHGHHASSNVHRKSDWKCEGEERAGADGGEYAKGDEYGGGYEEWGGGQYDGWGCDELDGSGCDECAGYGCCYGDCRCEQARLRAMCSGCEKDFIVVLRAQSTWASMVEGNIIIKRFEHMNEITLISLVYTVLTA